jgi:hypothetical protein
MRRTGLFPAVVLFTAACAGSPNAPSTVSVAASPTHGVLNVDSLGVSDVAQSAPGVWDYTVTAQLHETGGVDVTVTDIQIQALLGSTNLATNSTVPLLPMPAHSTRQTTVVFEAAIHTDVSALTVNITVQFIDAHGNAGSIRESFSGFGAWDY